MWNQTQQIVYVVYENLCIFCMTIYFCCAWHILITIFVYIVYDIKYDLKRFYIIQ